MLKRWESLPSNEQHGDVLSKEQEQPAANEGHRESHQRPFLSNDWKCYSWHRNWWSISFLVSRPASQGTRAAPSMKMLTVQFSSLADSSMSSGRERRALDGQAITLPRENAPNVAVHRSEISAELSHSNLPPRVATNWGIKLYILFVQISQDIN